MVFQDFALFPHLTLAQNISFGIKHLKKSKRESRTAEMLELVNMAYFSWRYPHELSGGQQQRAALARALAPKPDILLLDEPFSSMDVELRHELALELRLILKHENITALMVTHDQNEAFAISDNIGVMDNGKLLQWDNAYDLYHKPKTSFVANFIGEGVLIEGEVIAGNKVKTPLMILEGKTPPGSKSGDKVKVLIRPDDIVHDDCSPLSATIKNKMFRGSSYLYQLELDNGNELLSMVHSHHSHAVGSRLGIVMEMEHMVVFPDNSQP
jgi:iron(III) transport system ATP-binding protein